VRALGRILAAASIAMAAIFGLTGVAAAECDGPPPPFVETVASAKRIVIGDVVAIDPASDAGPGRSRHFTLQVSHVVRGQLIERLDVNDVPMQECAGDLVAGLGDRIALALDATAFTPAIPANGVAWIAGRTPEGLETTTIEDVYKLAGVPMPEPPAAAPTPDVTSVWLGPAVWGLAVALVLVVVGVVGRRLVAAR
jgi:hypothetical protein